VSKIGKKNIVVPGVQIKVNSEKPHDVHYQGKCSSGVYVLPPELVAECTTESTVALSPAEAFAASALVPRRTKELWGLHRALLLARLQGAAAPFERRIKIVGLGFKVLIRGSQMEFSLGYSHKVPFELPQGVAATVDKTGQKLALQSSDKELLGLIASKIRELRKPERYKGTGVLYEEEVIVLKAGKTK
jgi:large subunit ribosomal protein L6